MKSPAKQTSPIKGKVHTHPHPEEKKKESKGTKTDYPLNQFGNIDWSKVPRGEGQGTMKVSPVEMKSPVKDKDKIAKAKSRVQDAKETVTAYKEPGETRKLGTSIWQDTDMGTGETRATKKSERKLKRAEKKISKAEKLYAKGKTKRAERKLKRATKKADKAISIMTKHGSGRTKRTVQDKYKDDPRYKGEQAEYDSQFR
jgi:hypothetical protein